MIPQKKTKTTDTMIHNGLLCVKGGNALFAKFLAAGLLRPRPAYAGYFQSASPFLSRGRLYGTI